MWEGGRIKPRGIGDVNESGVFSFFLPYSHSFAIHWGGGKPERKWKWKLKGTGFAGIFRRLNAGIHCVWK
jgi:hypothetical protein